jgi:hypothetical protein
MAGTKGDEYSAKEAKARFEAALVARRLLARSTVKARSSIGCSADTHAVMRSLLYMLEPESADRQYGSPLSGIQQVSSSTPFSKQSGEMASLAGALLACPIAQGLSNYAQAKLREIRDSPRAYGQASPP